MGKSSGKPVTPLYLKSSMTHLSSLTIAWEKNVSGKFDTIHRADLRISDIGNLLGSDWVRVAHALDIADSDINIIKSLGSAYSVKFQTFSLQLAGNIGHQCWKQGRRAGSMTDLLY